LQTPLATRNFIKESASLQAWFYFRLISFRHATLLTMALHLLSGIVVHLIYGSDPSDYLLSGGLFSNRRVVAIVITYVLHAIQVAVFVGALHTLGAALRHGAHVQFVNFVQNFLRSNGLASGV
jgi:hypothetical protein